MKISDSKKIELIVQKQFTENPHRRLSACFRFLRKQKRFDLQGDYSLIANILVAIYKLGIIPSRNEVIHMLNQSAELRAELKGTKTKLLNQLLELSSVVTKDLEIPQEQQEKERMNHSSSLKGNK